MNDPLTTAYILVVEDDPDAYLITLDLLRMAGANRCYARRSVKQALTFAEQLPKVDIFLADINMPNLSGYDLIKMIREHKTLSEAKVVAVSAGTLTEDIEQARSLGFDGFIGKPIKPTQFAQQVSQVLQGESIWDWR